jgi:hypothetical protein
MSRRSSVVLGVVVLGFGLVAVAELGQVVRAASPAATEWAANVTVIEACSCPMFCQCYFNAKPAAHHGDAMAAGHHEHAAGAEHFCRANLACRVNKGHFGSVNLDGVKYWIANDLGGDFSKGQMDWATMIFDKAMTKPQRDAVQEIMTSVFPVKWNSFTTAEGTVDHWEYDKDTAYASLDGGKAGEIRLRRFPGMTDDPIVIKNLKYWGVPRHDGFVLMPNEVEAYRVGPKAFEYKNSNGFMITWDMGSKDLAPPATH